MDKKKLEESKKIIEQIQSSIKSSNEDEANYFLEKAHSSFETSKRLFDLIESESLNAQMWVINTSYYSMFFAVTAILAKKNKKITQSMGIPKLTFHAFICFFYEKIKQNFIEDYKTAINDVEELLQFSEEQTDFIISDYSFEIEKRKKFTYFMGEKAEISKAKTSLERARNFLIKIDEIFDNM